jgi:hypothetical protein
VISWGGHKEDWGEFPTPPSLYVIKGPAVHNMHYRHVTYQTCIISDQDLKDLRDFQDTEGIKDLRET